jgi:hypothetical protein
MRRLPITLLLLVLLLAIGQSVLADAPLPFPRPAHSENHVPQPAQATTATPSESAKIPGIHDLVQRSLEKLRARLLFLAQSAPRVPQELSIAAGRLSQAASETGLRTLLAWLLLFVTGGVTAELLFWQATRTRRRRIAAAPSTWALSASLSS